MGVFVNTATKLQFEFLLSTKQDERLHKHYNKAALEFLLSTDHATLGVHAMHMIRNIQKGKTREPKDNNLLHVHIEKREGLASWRHAHLVYCTCEISPRISDTETEEWKPA